MATYPMDNKEYAVRVNHVSMKFNMNKEKITSLKEYLIKFISGKLRYTEFVALDDISLCIEKGSVFALVGNNGAGKSTLLKIIAGVLRPVSGSVEINGTIAPLIELGAGFDMDLTARENVFLNGAVLGYSRRTMHMYYDDIIDFAELEEFQDVPVKNFSSGMMARLGFAIATIIKPDILIVDEVLSVGDFKFQEKCNLRIQSMIRRGTTVLLVSHSLSTVRKMCTHAAWLENGKIVEIGDAEMICDKYSNS